MKLKGLLAIFCIFALTSCASYKINNHLEPCSLDSNQKVLIALPKDGAYNSKIYVGSGNKTQEALHSAFSKYTDRITTVAVSKSLADIRKIAKQLGADILIYPTISHWEDRNTAWSGRKDHIEMEITVVSLKDNKTIDLSSLTANGSSMAWRNKTPDALLPKMFNKYVSKLYGNGN